MMKFSLRLQNLRFASWTILSWMRTTLQMDENLELIPIGYVKSL